MVPNYKKVRTESKREPVDNTILAWFTGFLIFMCFVVIILFQRAN